MKWKCTLTYIRQQESSTFHQTWWLFSVVVYSAWCSSNWLFSFCVVCVCERFCCLFSLYRSIDCVLSVNDVILFGWWEFCVCAVCYRYRTIKLWCIFYYWQWWGGVDACQCFLELWWEFAIELHFQTSSREILASVCRLILMEWFANGNGWCTEQSTKCYISHVLRSSVRWMRRLEMA